MAGIPNRAFKILEFRRLRIPISWYIQAQTSIESIFIEIALTLRRLVEIQFHFFASLVKIDDSVPLSVQGFILPTIDIRDICLCSKSLSTKGNDTY